MGRFTKNGDGRPGGGNGKNKNWGFGATEGSEDGDHLKGTKPGNDTPDTIEGLGGRDNLNGFDGDDLIVGGEDADDITGGEGDDDLIGGGYADLDPVNDGSVAVGYTGEGTVYQVGDDFWWDGAVDPNTFVKVTLEAGDSGGIASSGGSTVVGEVDRFDMFTEDGATDTFNLEETFEKNGEDTIWDFEAATPDGDDWILGDVVDVKDVAFDQDALAEELDDDDVGAAELGDQKTVSGSDLASFIYMEGGMYIAPEGGFQNDERWVRALDGETGNFDDEMTICIDLPTATLTDFDPVAEAEEVREAVGEAEGLVYRVGSDWWWDRNEPVDGSFRRVTGQESGGAFLVENPTGDITQVGEADEFDTWEADGGSDQYYAVWVGFNDGGWDIFEA